MWKWTSRKISYTSIMIAVAVVFVLLGSMMFAITAYPSFKVSFAGLPIKLAGYLLGPLVGAITGFLADIISFMYLPTFYNPGYSLTMSLSGMIPGIIMWIMIRKPRGIHTHFFATLSIFILIWGFMFWLFWTFPLDINSHAQNAPKYTKLFLRRWEYLVLGLGGITGNIFILLVLRFSLKPENFISIAPIMMLTSILGVINSFMMPLWDLYTLNIPYAINLLGHYLLTLPIKLWFNIVVIYVAWKIIHPIIDKNNNDYWK